MKVTIIPIVTDDLGTVTKGLVQGLENLEITGRVEAVQTYEDQPEYWEESWGLEETCHSNSSGKPLANADVKNSQGVRRALETWGDLLSLNL